MSILWFIPTLVLLTAGLIAILASFSSKSRDDLLSLLGNYLPWVVVVVLTLICGILSTVSPFWGAVLLGVPLIMLTVGFKKIPAEPPHIAVVTIWGNKIRGVKDEGYALTAPYFPFLHDLIMQDNEVENIDHTFHTLPCNSKARDKKPVEEELHDFNMGGTVFADLSISYVINEDGQAAINFIDYGGHDGIKNQILDMIGQYLRRIANWNTYRKMTSSNGEITACLIKLLTGQDAGSARHEIEQFINQMSSNPIPDTHNMGIKFKKINLPRIYPEGKLAEVAEQQAVELEERRRDKEDMKTELQLYDMIKEKAPEMSQDKVRDWVQVHRGMADRIIIDGEVGPSALAALAAFGLKSSTTNNKKGT